MDTSNAGAPDRHASDSPVQEPDSPGSWRVTLPRATQTPVTIAQLWALGALGVWEQPDVVVAWFPLAAIDDPKVRDSALLEGVAFEPEPERDWQAEWKATIGPVRAGRTLVVPSWLVDDHRPGPDELMLVLDPGRAFGSGHHATTVLCLEVLDDLAQQGWLDGRRVADVGCGSGILAIAAAARGARTQAVDIDPAAIDVTTENAARNNVTLDVRLGSLEAVRPPVDLVVANLITDVVAELADPLVRTSGERLVVSGITAQRQRVALDPLERAGARVQQVRSRDGGTSIYKLGDQLRVERRAGLYGELKAAFGPDAIDEGGDRIFAESPETGAGGWRRT